MNFKPVENATPEIEIHRAGGIVINPYTLLENGYVSLQDNRIVNVGRWNPRIDGKIIDHGGGIIIPSFVNVHTHLELSFLKNRLHFNKGFKQWVKELIFLRDGADDNEIKQGIEHALQELASSGCRIAGEIATIGLYEDVFYSRMEGVYFHESLGHTDQKSPEIGSYDNKVISLAGHAPHTTSPDLIRLLKNKCMENTLPFSIHVAESEDEDVFIKTGKGEWASFLSSRGIEYSSWPVTPEGPVRYLEKLGILDDKTIAVHALMTEKNDLHILKNKNVHVCLCPRSNVNLHNKLPDAVSMYRENVSLCLGTDSLASTDSLSIYDEMVFMCNMFQEIPPVELYKMATVNGAHALGLQDHCGTVEAGKSGSLFYLSPDDINDSEIFSFIKR